MASYSSSAVRRREKKLRARYRKKIWIVAIIMLIIGLVAGYLLCVKFNDRIMDRTVDAAPEATPEIVYVTPQPAEADDLEENADEEEFYNNLVNEAESEGDMDITVEDFEETADDFDEDIIDFENFNDPGEDSENEEEPDDEDMEALTALALSLPDDEPEAEAEEPVAEAETEETAEEPAVEAEAEEPAVEAEAEEPAVEAEAEEPAVEAEAEEPAVEAEAEEPVVEAEAEEPVLEAEAEEPAVEAEAEEPVVEAPAEPIIVPYGETQAITTQILLDGSARRDTSSAEYETLNLDLKIDAYKDFDYFERNYGSTYNLQGGTAAVEFDLTLKDYGGVVEIIPQNFLLITLRGEKEEDFNQGYQLMDTEIAGKTGIVITSNNTATLYKRYPFNAEMGDMRYLAVTTYNDGVETEYWFDIIDPNPAPPIVIAQDLVMGSSGEEVKQLQEKLIEMGILNDVADGKFGRNTMEAVKKAQEQLGLEQTGVANQDFIIALFK